jgi:hypothetical protein
VFALFDTRDIAWFAVGMVVQFGLIHAWFYAPQGTLYASLYPTRIRYTGLSTIYQVSGILCVRAHTADSDQPDRGGPRRAVVCLRLSGCDCCAQRGCDDPAQPTMSPDAGRVGAADKAHGVAGQSLGIGHADVLWSSCDCSDR